MAAKLNFYLVQKQMLSKKQSQNSRYMKQSLQINSCPENSSTFFCIPETVCTFSAVFKHISNKSTPIYRQNSTMSTPSQL